jgi:hypothetical protein
MRFAVVCASILVCLAGSTARADLRFAAPRAKVGELRSGAKVAHSFAFVNEGPDAVEILEARPGCGCLTPLPARRVYGPGEEGSIPLEINARGQSAGPHTWRLALRYRAGAAERETTLEVTAQVLTEVTLQPAALTLFADGPLTQEIVLTDTRPHPLTVTATATSCPALRARLTEPYRDGLGHWLRKITLEIDACPEGRHAERLLVYTNDPDYRELEVPITLVKRARQRLTATPDRVALRLAPGDTAASCCVRLVDRQGDKVIVEAVTADKSGIVCRWAPGPGNGATVRMQVERDRVGAGAFEGTVRVRLSAPVPETVSIPVSCTPAEER